LLGVVEVIIGWSLHLNLVDEEGGNVIVEPFAVWIAPF